MTTAGKGGWGSGEWLGSGRDKPRYNIKGGGWGRVGPGVWLNQKQYIIKGMTCRMGLHLVFKVK